MVYQGYKARVDALKKVAAARSSGEVYDMEILTRKETQQPEVVEALTLASMKMDACQGRAEPVAQPATLRSRRRRSA